MTGVLRAQRRLMSFAAVLVGAFAGVTSCANQAQPPGGPPDAAPPLVLSVTPKTLSTDPKIKSVQLRFDEVISETPRGGAKNLADLVFISPKSGEPRVSWGRTHIDIRPSKGWKHNTTYTVQIKPGLADLRGNGIDTSIRVVFSTGGPLAETHVRGVVFDWAAGKGMPQAVVEAITKDSTVYQSVADSSGRFDLAYVPIGPLRLKAFGDKNNNKEQDPLEPWDTVSITMTQLMAADFYAFQHDSAGLRIADVAVLDSNRALKVTFDKPYSPTQAFSVSMLRLMRPDSSPIGVKLVQSARDRVTFDSLKAKQKQDSVDRIRRAREDSTPGLRERNDSLARVRRADSIANVERQQREADRIAARDAARQGRRLPPRTRDTLPPPRMSRPPVYTEVFVTLDSALPPGGAFRLQMLNVRNLSEVAKSPSRAFTTARAPRVDSTRARRDSAPPASRGGAPPGTPPVRRDTVKPAPVKRDTLSHHVSATMWLLKPRAP